LVLVRIFIRCFFVSCFIASIVLAAFWVRSYYVVDIVRHLSANQKTLQTQEYLVIVNRGRLYYCEDSMTYDQADGFDFALAADAEAGERPGTSWTFERPFDEWVSIMNPIPWLTRLGISANRSSESIHIDRARPAPPQRLGDAWEVGVEMNMPIWELWLLFLIPSLFWTFCFLRGKRRSQRRWETAHCRKCNYDLRASKGRCPECGTPF